MQNSFNIVTVLGSTHKAVEVVFRKVFEHNTCLGTILVLDYMGRGAAVLSEFNKTSMLKKNVLTNLRGFYEQLPQNKKTSQCL